MPDYCRCAEQHPLTKLEARTWKRCPGCGASWTRHEMHVCACGAEVCPDCVDRKHKRCRVCRAPALEREGLIRGQEATSHA